ncbi:hypothetical protein G3I62_27525 [Streptomyces sp. SID14446]|uniref:hypothetical protein n=1 Tax=Streptomyces sp. SID14446 TaxID=2706072 RepID=UPI0013BA5AFC|nr:hypothetical protein [Streptomyces sp. SID14446]NEB32798.1 hypothetical protein [Streptomyces sp. SID14446]
MTASAALYEALHVFEVVLRNAIHEQLTLWHRAEGRTGSWIDNPPPTLTTRSQQDLRRARRYAQDTLNVKHQKTGAQTSPPAPSDGDVIAQLTLGFWRYMLAARHTHGLWHDAVRHAFPHLQPQDLQTVEKPVVRLHTLRNRIAHLEPVFANNLKLHLRDMKIVTGYICPRTESWFTSTRSQAINDAIASSPLNK